LERNPPHGVMQPCGLRPEQEAAVSLICSPRRNTPATGSWSSLPRDGAAPPTKDGSPCPRRLQRPRPLPQRRVTHRLPRGGDRLLRVRSAERSRRFEDRDQEDGRKRWSVSSAATRDSRPCVGGSHRQRRGPDLAASAGPTGWRTTGQASAPQHPPWGSPFFARSVAKRLFAGVRCVPPEDRGCC
jgi:hypothetical protein